MSWNPLEVRTYRYKKPSLSFYCPLCSTERAILTSPYLDWKNYLQISLLSGAFIYFTFPVMQWRSFFVFFILWAVFEFVRRSLFRKEVPCPHCGFDAGWYHRDVKVAKSKVKAFWTAEEARKVALSTAPKAGPSSAVSSHVHTS